MVKNGCKLLGMVGNCGECMGRNGGESCKIVWNGVECWGVLKNGGELLGMMVNV